MQCRASTSRIRLAAWLVPVVLAPSLALPNSGTLKLGIAEAMACTGGGPGTGGAVAPPEPMWQRLAPAGAAGAVTPIATDGFLPLRGIYTGLSVEEALASINLIVTDETGKKVPGSIEAIGAPHQQVFGWTATEALAIGQRLTAFISVTTAFDPPSNLTQTYALEVEGLPEALPEPPAEFNGWSDTYKGIGPVALCQLQASSCGPSSLQEISSNFEATGHSVELFSKLAPQSGVAWEISLAAPFGSPESTSYSSYPVLVTSAYEGTRVFGEIAFGFAAKEVCAIVIAKDLRTGTEARGEVCGAPEPATRIKTDGLPLSSCEEPPSAAAHDLWCEARKKDSRPCDEPGPVAAASDRIAATSQGCQQGAPGSSPSWTAWALSLAALGVGVARRRRYSA